MSPSHRRFRGRTDLRRPSREGFAHDWRPAGRSRSRGRDDAASSWTRGPAGAVPRWLQLPRGGLPLAPGPHGAAGATQRMPGSHAGACGGSRVSFRLGGRQRCAAAPGRLGPSGRRRRALRTWRQSARAATELAFPVEVARAYCHLAVHGGEAHGEAARRALQTLRGHAVATSFKEGRMALGYDVSVRVKTDDDTRRRITLYYDTVQVLYSHAWSRTGVHYGSVGQRDGESFDGHSQHGLLFVADRLELAPGRRVLDAGCAESAAPACSSQSNTSWRSSASLFPPIRCGER